MSSKKTLQWQLWKQYIMGPMLMATNSIRLACSWDMFSKKGKSEIPATIWGPEEHIIIKFYVIFCDCNIWWNLYDWFLRVLMNEIAHASHFLQVRSVVVQFSLSDFSSSPVIALYCIITLYALSHLTLLVHIYSILMLQCSIPILSYLKFNANHPSGQLRKHWQSCSPNWSLRNFSPET